MATMKPTHLTTIRSKEVRFIIGGKEVKTEENARNEIERLNMNSHIKKIDVRIHAPDVYNSYLEDYPGLFFVSKDNPELPKSIKTCQFNF